MTIDQLNKAKSLKAKIDFLNHLITSTSQNIIELHEGDLEKEAFEKIRTVVLSEVKLEYDKATNEFNKI